MSSAADGPDLLAEELDVVRKMKLAVQEERYNDAGTLLFFDENVKYDMQRLICCN